MRLPRIPEKMNTSSRTSPNEGNDCAFCALSFLFELRRKNNESVISEEEFLPAFPSLGLVR